MVRCPRCGREGRLEEYEVNGRRYLRVVHGGGRNRERCYLGPADGYEAAGPLLLLRLHNLMDVDYAEVAFDAITTLLTKVKLEGLGEPGRWLPKVRELRSALEVLLPELRRLEEELERLRRQAEGLGEGVG